jgi:flavin reductase (DIM6/NTAB) family NADH-FMN oxidoreductase RutF
MTMHQPPKTHRIEPQDLRRTLGCFPTGVAIVTALGQRGAPVGLTISSFNSVSMDPPLILWSLALSSASLADFRGAGHFAVNILSADQAALPRVFSSPVDERFEAVEWQPGAGGAPVITGSAAVLECRTYNRCDGGDHEIFLGEVLRHGASDLVPLVYGKGRLGPFSLPGEA